MLRDFFLDLDNFSGLLLKVIDLDLYERFFLFFCHYGGLGVDGQGRCDVVGLFELVPDGVDFEEVHLFGLFEVGGGDAAEV